MMMRKRQKQEKLETHVKIIHGVGEGGEEGKKEVEEDTQHATSASELPWKQERTAAFGGKERLAGKQQARVRKERQNQTTMPSQYEYPLDEPIQT
ncbi:hypothetical protein N7510_006118 [Penicillium lagena]|uniref:uncharacterized protein n=1 Tax=Penicillium lagena TaxID=94218 RepID=UPI0025409A3A|nr:uncharacterized protein N7510_006118 [Penicillium lagena]KAJ5612924.1 hypothetical protein N7510_006118 [Penicillium lagena]